MKNQTYNRGKSTKRIVAGTTAATAFVAAHSIIPAVVFAANQYSWMEQDLGNSGGSITAVAISAGGSHLILAGGENKGLYISDNSGATWENIAEEVDPGVEASWSSVDVANNGQTMVAAYRTGFDIEAEESLSSRIFISEDGGDSWNNITPADTDNWRDVVVSGDGSTLAAVRYDSSDVYISENDGASWTTSEFDEDAWGGMNVAISDDGSKLLVGGENDDSYRHLSLSDDGGDSWEAIDPDVEDEIIVMSPAISADGDTIAVSTFGLAGGENHSIFTSNNDGADWTDITPEADTSKVWYDLAISDDGSTLSALDIVNQKMHISGDTGASWTEENPQQDYNDDAPLIVTDLNSDGTKFIVASQDAAYLNFAAEPTVTLEDAEGGKTITITTPEGTTITCHSAVKESEQEVTDAAYTYPLGLVDFCFSGAEENNEVTLVFVTNLKPDDVLVRKYNPDNTEYATVDEAVVTETTYEDKHALQVTYNIVDNGPLDLDPDDGEVADPIGLAVVGDDGVLADTGSNATNATLLAVGLLGIGFFFLLRRKKT